VKHWSEASRQGIPLGLEVQKVLAGQKRFITENCTARQIGYCGGIFPGPRFEKDLMVWAIPVTDNAVDSTFTCTPITKAGQKTPAKDR